ncbi:MAG TPA: retropepsin-like aspartic protease [Candidatus Elarobacter sp.]
MNPTPYRAHVRPSLTLSLAAAAAVACASVTAPSAAAPQRADDAAASAIVARVRTAIGYAALKQRLHAGFVVEESEAAAAGATAPANAKVLLFGPAGRYREESKPSDGRPLGFDGRLGWQVDRAGLAVPLPQRLREKILIPAWVRGGWWLDDAAPLSFSVLPAESNADHVTIALRAEHGLVDAKIVIDRTTWLPSTLVVGYERGPYTVTFSDYRTTLGFRFPQTVVIRYRDSATEYRVTSVAPAQTASFAPPPLPPDTAFDDSAPADVKVAQGVPFSKSAPGHYYVRAAVDGKDAGWFHFDSGSDTMQIDAKIADALNMPVLGRTETRGADGRPQQVTIRQGKTFQLGRMTYRNPIFLASDMADKNAPPGQARAGIVGFPFFARAVVEVAGGGKRIAVYDPKRYVLARGRWQDLSFIDLTPAVVCRFEGDRHGLFQLDTGFVGTVTFYDKFIKDEKLLEGRQVKDDTDVGAGGSYKLLTGKLAWFELAGRRFAEPTVGFRVEGLSREGGAGVVGRELLSAVTVVFDYPSRRVAFLR